MRAAQGASEGWAGTCCLVTGGLGFVGSNLVRALVACGARVRVVDALVPEHGGRADQLDGVDVDAVRISSIADPGVAELLVDVDVVFDVAGQVSHSASMRDPQTDLAVNATEHAALLETIRGVRPMARLVYASTRQVYGRSAVMRVDESAVPVPVDVNGVSKLAGEQLHLVYHHAYGMPATVLRLTNVYGPCQRLTSDELGFLPVFIRKALLGETIEIFGDGRQRRDCLHVDDVVSALMTSAASDAAVGAVLNVGHPETHSVAEVAEAVVAAAGSSAGVRIVPFPDEHARIDIGSFHTVSDRIEALLGWRARISLGDGLADTIDFYRSHPWYLSST